MHMGNKNHLLEFRNCFLSVPRLTHAQSILRIQNLTLGPFSQLIMIAFQMLKIFQGSCTMTSPEYCTVVYLNEESPPDSARTFPN